jgi:hypothetical protein
VKHDSPSHNGFPRLRTLPLVVCHMAPPAKMTESLCYCRSLKRRSRRRGIFSGGWGGIRTHERLAPLPVFKTGALNRSATHPQQLANGTLYRNETSIGIAIGNAEAMRQNQFDSASLELAASSWSARRGQWPRLKAADPICGLKIWRPQSGHRALQSARQCRSLLDRVGVVLSENTIIFAAFG